MQRRVLATFEKQWILPYTRVSVASRPETFDQYIARMDGDMERLVHILVGDVDRMAQYAQLGYQSDQWPLSKQVDRALQSLIVEGYTHRML